MQYFTENNDKLGFYRIGRQVFNNKVSALLATVGNDEHPTWHFNDEEFDRFNFSIEPEQSLMELYYQRAKQLREKYDYIVVMFSGGADSSTVVKSFVNNGLHLDEVIVGHPQSGLRDWRLSLDPATANTMSEFEYAVKPQLEWLALASPNTKITLNDYWEDMLITYTNDDWFMLSKEFFHPTTASRYSKRHLPHIVELCESGKEVAFVYGIDKPRMAVIDGVYHMYFLDIIANISTWDLPPYPNARTEYFYWSPDLPQVIAKQCHAVVRWLNLPENRQFRPLFNWPPPSHHLASKLKTIYERVVREALYPDWDFSLFQAGKPSNQIWAEHDWWFFENHRDTHIFDVWSAGMQHAQKLVPEKWWQKDETGRVTGLRGMISRMRPICAESPLHKTITAI